MSKKTLTSACGADCEACAEKEACKGGCFASQGKVCYIAHTGLEVCPIYDCAINKKGYKSCAECSELPCKLMYEWKEPCKSEEEQRKSVEQRVLTLKASL